MSKLERVLPIGRSSARVGNVMHVYLDDLVK